MMDCPGSPTKGVYCQGSLQIASEIMGGLLKETGRGGALRFNTTSAIKYMGTLSSIGKHTLESIAKSVKVGGIAIAAGPKGNFKEKAKLFEGFEFLMKDELGEERVDLPVVRRCTHTWLLKREAIGLSTDLSDFKKYWSETFQLSPDAYSDSTAYRLLRKWKYAYRQQAAGPKKRVTIPEYVCQDIERYKEEFDEAKKLIEERLFHGVVYTDETFVYEYHFRKLSWFSSSYARLKVKGNGKGRIMTVIAAGTADGWIHGATEVTIPTTAAKSDYHKYWTAKTYVEWFATKLLLSLKRYTVDGHIPKRFIIILDNAPTHCTLPDGTNTPSAMSAAELARYCLKHCQEEYNKLPRKSMEFTRPLVKKHWDANRPKTRIQQLAEAAGHKVIYTPKTMSVYNPIEEAWGIVKGHVGKHYDHNSPLESAKVHLEEGFTKAHGVWGKLILRSDKALNDSIEAVAKARHLREVANDELIEVELEDGEDDDSDDDSDDEIDSE